MRKLGRTGSTFGTVVAASVVIAVASTGGAVASGLITSAKIKNNTIKSIDVRDGNLTGVDVADGSLSGADVADGSITGGDVQDGSLTGADINGATDGMIKAAAKVSSGGVLENSFTRLGGAITSSQNGTGDYTINIPGATGSTNDKIVGVTAYNSLAECKPWLGSGTTMTVTCWDTNTQTPRNASFSVWLIK
ncbi:MAG: hypothetical protein JF565_09415 [Propionibacteriales bacterium]|nr:hypothetical protein [Propionibacteriales bacterium]